MADETEVIPILQPEVIDPPAPARLADGKFGPGNCGRPKGTLNRVTMEMKAALALELEKAGDEGNPLIILSRVARNPDAPDAIKISAADRLLRYLLPQLAQVELQNSDPEFEIATATIKARLRGLFLEKPDVNNS